MFRGGVVARASVVLRCQSARAVGVLERSVVVLETAAVVADGMQCVRDACEAYVRAISLNLSWSSSRGGGAVVGRVDVAVPGSVRAIRGV